MDETLLQKLKDWRRVTAGTEGIDVFRIFSNRTLEDIAELRPANKEELVNIKGIKDKKFEKYGKNILDLVNSKTGKKNMENLFSADPASHVDEKDYISINEYLDNLNEGLHGFSGRIVGEVFDLKLYEGRSYLYFSLKDKNAEAVLSCFMWKRDYLLSGVEFEDGLEIIISGFPRIYKPNGGMAFQTQSIELVGEGALKQAYEKLKAELAKEGIFSEERKRPLPEYPNKIGIITSLEGAVIHDFLNNIGKFGFQIKVVNSRVEGVEATKELLLSLDIMKREDIDVLVVMRGGGSLESLQPFNNELLVRAVVDFPVPVIAAIGHDQDIPLIALAADISASTPSMAANILDKSWEEASQKTERYKEKILVKYEQDIFQEKEKLQRFTFIINESFMEMLHAFDRIELRFKGLFSKLDDIIRFLQKEILRYTRLFIKMFSETLIRGREIINMREKQLSIFNPERQLKLGYSIITHNGNIVKEIAGLVKDDIIKTRLSDGSLLSQIKSINKEK